MVRSPNGNRPRVELRVEEVPRGEDRGPTVMVACQAPNVVAPALPFLLAKVRNWSQSGHDPLKSRRSGRFRPYFKPEHGRFASRLVSRPPAPYLSAVMSGTLTTDTYSLKGFAKAYRAIGKACGL